MTPITVKVQQQPNNAGVDFSALAEQLIQESWHLPPEGDQSWREQDARRIFSGQGEDQINHGEAPPVEVAAEADDALPEPGLEAPKALGILLPLSLATFVTAIAVTFSMPEILTAGFWSSAQTKQAPEVAISPVSMVNAAPVMPVRHEAPPSKLRPSLLEDVRPLARPDRMADKVEVLPIRQIAQESTVPKAASSHLVANTKLRVKRGGLPPIGEAYFASRARPTRTATTDWKAEAAKWDERVSQIQARREARTGSSSEFP